MEDRAACARAGRIINHLAHGIEEPPNDILFVGYTAAPLPTLAAKLAENRYGVC